MAVAVGLGVAVGGTGVAVGMAVAGRGVAVGTGVAVAGTDVAVGAGVAVGASSSTVKTYVLKCVSVDTAHTTPALSVSHRYANSVHSSPLTRYTLARPSAHASASSAGSAKRKSTPLEYVIGVGVSLPDTNVSTSAASNTRSFDLSPGGAPGDWASNLLTRISTFDGAAPAGTTSSTLSSVVVIVVSSLFAVTVALAVGPVTVSVTNTVRGVFDAPLALMTILPLYVPGLRSDEATDTVTVTLARGLFDDASLGETDSQLAPDDDTVNGMSTCRTVFHTSNVCEGGASPRCSAVNASVFVETATSGLTSSGVGVGVGDGVAVGTTSTMPPPPDGGGGGGAAVCTVAVGLGVDVGRGVGVRVGSAPGVKR